MAAMVGQGWLGATSLVRFDVAERRLVLPDVSVDIAWVDGRIDVIGPMSVARPSRYAIGTQVMLLSVDPVTAAAWLSLPLSNLVDQVVDLRDIDRVRAGELAARFERGDAGALVGGIAPATSRAGMATAALAAGARVADVAATVNLGERQLTRSIRDVTGHHPKRFQRIARLRRAVVAAKGGMALADAAVASGYADQAHFNREVKALTGASPRAILPNVGNVQDVAPPIDA